MLGEAFAVYLRYWRSAEHSWHWRYQLTLQLPPSTYIVREGKASTRRGHSSVWLAPQHVAHTSYSVRIWRKCFGVYCAKSPSELWLLASAMCPLPTPSQLPWDFPLLIADVLKTRIWVKFIRAACCCPALSPFGASTTQQNCVIQGCLQPSSCSQALYTTQYQSSLLLWWEIFTRKKKKKVLFSSPDCNEMFWWLCVWSCSLGSELWIWLTHKADLFWIGCPSFFLMETQVRWSWGGKWCVMRVKLNIGFLCGYVACLISGTPKCFQVHQLSGNLASLSASNIERFAPYLCTRNLTVFLVLQIKEE